MRAFLLVVLAATPALAETEDQYCEARTPDPTRAQACRVLAQGAADALARHDVTAALDQLRALDQLIAPHKPPPDPVCPPVEVKACPPVEAKVCPPQRTCPPRTACADRRLEPPRRRAQQGLTNPFETSRAHDDLPNPWVAEAPVPRPVQAPRPKRKPAQRDADLMNPF